MDRLLCQCNQSKGKRMNKHTPGPWKVSKPRKSYMNGEMMFRIDGADVVKDYEDWGFTEESARLIAAAPDLLEALQAMATEFDSGDVNDGEWAAIQKARTAIAKATGEKE